MYIIGICYMHFLGGGRNCIIILLMWIGSRHCSLDGRQRIAQLFSDRIESHTVVVIVAANYPP